MNSEKVDSRYDFSSQDLLEYCTTHTDQQIKKNTLVTEDVCVRYLHRRIRQKVKEHNIDPVKAFEAIEKANDLMIFFSPTELLSHVYKLNTFKGKKFGLKEKARATFAVAMSTIASYAAYTTVGDGEKPRPAIIFFRNKSGKELAQILAHELEHVADGLLGLINDDEVKKGRKLSRINVGYITLFFSLIAPPVTEALKNTYQLEGARKDIVFFGLAAIAILGSHITVRRYKKLSHEAPANKAMKDILQGKTQDA